MWLRNLSNYAETENVLHTRAWRTLRYNIGTFAGLNHRGENATCIDRYIDVDFSRNDIPGCNNTNGCNNTVIRGLTSRYCASLESYAYDSRKQANTYARLKLLYLSTPLSLGSQWNLRQSLRVFLRSFHFFLSFQSERIMFCINTIIAFLVSCLFTHIFYSISYPKFSHYFLQLSRLLIPDFSNYFRNLSKSGI